MLPILERDPAVLAVTLFRHLQMMDPDAFPDDRVRRTLERRVRDWRALHGAPKDVIFRQSPEPGRMALSDFTDAGGLGVTIAGRPFDHRLYHFALAYSGWEHAAVVLGGESFAALAEHLQNALWGLGGVPHERRTDSLSAAYRNLTREDAEDATRRYEELCAHYGLIASRNNPGEAHENGAVESHHRHLKTAIDQALILRGQRDFASLAEYRTFVDQLVARRNRRREDAVRVEMAALRPLPPRRTTDFTEIVARVTRTGGFLVHSVFYSAPARLIGHRLRVHVHDDRVEAWLGGTHVLTPRRRAAGDGKRVHVVDYRHVIHALKRKPQALAGSVFRDSLFPREEYAQGLGTPVRGAAPEGRLPAHGGPPRARPRRGLRGRARPPDRRGPQRQQGARRARPARPARAAGPRSARRRPRRAHRAGQLRRPAGGARMTAREIDVHTLPSMLTALRLPSFTRRWQGFAEQADKEGWPAARFLAALAECELAERETRRIQRHLNASHLPGGKTLATFDFKALPRVPRRRIEALAAGDWLETGANLIAIGNSGAGKTHLLCAIGHALIEAGHRVLYTRTTDLVQRLQAARRDLALEAALAKLDKFDLIILDDIAYAQKDQAETSVLFELIARRYETRSLAIAANQPFSAWDRVFPDPKLS